MQEDSDEMQEVIEVQILPQVGLFDILFGNVDPRVSFDKFHMYKRHI